LWAETYCLGSLRVPEAPVSVDMAIVAALFAAIAGGAVLLDRGLAPRQPGPVKALAGPSVSD
jgi:hypothetical protein